MKIKSKKLSLKKNIVNLLLLSWVLPVIIMTSLLATYVDRRTNEQIEANVLSSLTKAVDIFDLELSACERASKNASYYSNIREAYLTYQSGGKEREFISEVNGFLRSEYKYNEIAKAALLYFPKEGKAYYTYNNSADGSYKDVEFFFSFANDYVQSLVDEIGTGTALINVGGRAYMVRNLVLTDFTPYATLCIEMNTPSFLQGMQSVWGYKDVVILMGDSYFMGSKNSVDWPEVERVKSLLSEKPTTFLRQNRTSYVGASWKKYGKNLVAIVSLDNQQIYQKLYATWVIFGAIVGLMIPLTAWIFRYFRINSYREEIALRDAQIMALQSQINPHFLNNTFEIINWEARLNGNIKVSRMIEALSVMMEATMNRRGNHMNSLAEEISYVDAYAYIISERLGEKFSYKKEIDESLMSFQVPKLIVQPIVENAVEHGLSEVQKGNIVLSVFREGRFICIEIQNDGPLSEENKQKIEHLLSDEIDPEKERSLSLGIRNVHNRLKLIYGDESGLSIQSKDDSYTISTIRILAPSGLEQ